MFNNYGYGGPQYGYPIFNQQHQQLPPKTNIEYVNGIEGAKAFPLPPNCKALLVDSDSKSFFIKTTDLEGKPTLERFSYSPYTTETAQKAEYVTVAQFNELAAQFSHLSAQFDHLSKNDKVETGGV